MVFVYPYSIHIPVIFHYSIPSWWFQPLWKIWVRQLGLLFHSYSTQIPQKKSHQSGAAIKPPVLLAPLLQRQVLRPQLLHGRGHAAGVGRGLSEVRLATSEHRTGAGGTGEKPVERPGKIEKNWKNSEKMEKTMEHPWNSEGKVWKNRFGSGKKYLELE